jgi:hypothetical protein
MPGAPSVFLLRYFTITHITSKSMSVFVQIFALSLVSPGLQVLAEILRECQRLIGRAINPESSQLSFLDALQYVHLFFVLHESDFWDREDDISLPILTLFGRKAQSLIMFVGSAIKSNSSGTPAPAPNNVSTTDLVRLLIEIATVQTRP